MIASRTIPLSVPPLRRRVFHGLQKAVYWSGAAAVYKRIGPLAGAKILMYHSVADSSLCEWIDPANSNTAECFEAQMRFLAEHRSVVSMDTLVQSVRAGEELPAGTVALTFDDGYRDNLLVAAPILARYQLPATLYLPTGYIQRRQNQWIDDLYSYFRRRQRQELQFEGRRRNLATASAARRTYSAISAKLMCSTLSQRQQILSEVRDQLQPDAGPPRLTLSWDEVRELQRDYPRWEVGVHTADHIDLSEHPHAAAAELAQSISDVQRELGIPPRHFSYPYFRCSDAARQAVISSGLESAVVGGRQYLINKSADPFCLGRLTAPDSVALLAFWTSAAYPGLSRALFGRP